MTKTAPIQASARQPSDPQGNDEARKLLVDLLHQAAQLEHCLLDSYLYTACSIKSTPQEFADAAGKLNRRRAIQFERARGWRQSIFMVTHEEMLHLHYVECLLRALGEPPSFALPERDEQSGSWIMPNWRARVGNAPVDQGKGVHIPVEPLTPNNISRFVLYEASDSLQDDDPFGPNVRNLFSRLHDFEVDLYFESVLFDMADDASRSALKQKLSELYTTLTPLAEEDKLVAERVAQAVSEAGLPPLEDVRFQSIADLYTKGIQPLYEQAFDFGWVRHANRDLNNEMLNPNYAAQGFLPVGPTYRDKNFEQFYTANKKDPLRHYKNVADIISEIVEEGEGQAGFLEDAERLLSKVQELGGARAYLQAVQLDQQKQNDDSYSTPGWLADAQALRLSHLYRFAMIMTELQQERELAQQSGLDFSPVRTPLTVDGAPRLKQMAAELPSQFNACYLVLLVWLSRMYEIPDWREDKTRRMAIEMLVSWPMMSMAIRPFLELASFFPIDPRTLFRLDQAALPFLPIHGQQLLQLFTSPQRSETINEQMDYLVERVLSNAAAWAADQQDVIANANLDANAQEMIVARLTELAQLDEFHKQFPFRVAGGYSNVMPDLTYQQDHPDAGDFSEDPSLLSPAATPPGNPLFENTLALRLRFAGWGLVQLSTDPDPPYDEAGCTGTLMLHAADGDGRFDRSLIWQDSDPQHSIRRAPRDQLPQLGVNCVDVSLVVTNNIATAGYVPLQVMNSAGAVQASGLQQDLGVQGLLELLTVTPDEILGQGRQLRVDLLAKNGVRPFLNGNNHVIWQDGEPIDPFILAVSADPSAGAPGETQPEVLFQREVYNRGLSLMEMSPLQRLESAREPCGFDSYNSIPAWALSQLSPTERTLLDDANFPISYLQQRATVLGAALSELVSTPQDDSQQTVDAIVSLAERMRLVAQPRGTTVGWLTVLLHYGHTLSGDFGPISINNPVFALLGQRTGLQLGLPTLSDRMASNARWLVKYTKGVMDTDALSDLVYGELYIPVSVQSSNQPIELAYSWTFPAAMKQAIAEYACQFDTPFWATFNVQGKQRTTTLPDGTLITETRMRQTKNSYTYTMTGVGGINDYTGAFTLSSAANDSQRVKLEWKLKFKSDNPEATVRMVTTITNGAQAIGSALTSYVAPGD